MTELSDISNAESQLIAECLRAVAVGPFIPDWEFQTLFGVERSDVASLADKWPNVDLRNAEVVDIVCSALNNLLGYPHGKDAYWSEFISATRQELDELQQSLFGSGGVGPG